MVSSVRSRPNHYEVLGLPIAATEDQIAQAFAKAMGMFGARPLAAVAQLSAAFETLRNPSKRRAYDAALGLRPEPALRPWAIAATQRGTAHFSGSAWASPLLERRDEETKTTVAEATPTVEPKAEPESALPNFITEALRELASPAPREIPLPSKQPEPEAPIQIEMPSVSEAEDASIDWRRPVFAVGAFILAAGGIGAIAGLSAGKDAQEPQQAQAKVTTPVPAAKVRAEVAQRSAVPAAFEAVGVAVPPRAPKHAVVARRAPALLPTQEIAASHPAAADAQSSFVESATEQAEAVEAPASPAIAADMPLSKAVVARTIDRIGYACGEVGSMTAIEGSSGAFKVTCSSGQSYRAAPVRGRYHFKRLNGG